MHIVHTEAHLFSVPNYCLWYDKLWGPSQRVVTLFFHHQQHQTFVYEHDLLKYLKNWVTIWAPRC